MDLDRRSPSSLVVLWWFGGAGDDEYLSGYLIEKSLSVDNVFVWALILSYFAVPAKYQHRVLFWGIFGALVLRAIVHLRRRRPDRALRLDALRVRRLPAVHRGRAARLGDDEHVDPGNSRFLQLVNRVVPSTDSSTGRTCSRRSTAGGWPRRCSPCSCSSSSPT